MSNIILSKEVSTAITTAVAAVAGATRKMESTIDTLHAAQMRSTDFVSPKSEGSTASPEQWEAIKVAIAKGFTAAVQKLLAAPTKALSETDKSDKRYWQQQIGARANDFKRGLEKREGKDDNRAPQPPKSPEDKIRAMIESIEKLVQGAEGLTFDAADFLKDLRALNRKIK
jgi:hypothetical protein